jgi:excisionase family DNA binding protein
MSEDMESENEKLLTPEEAADYLKVNISTVYRYFSEEKNPLPHYKIKGIVRIKKSELDEWINKHFEKEAVNIIE